MSTKFVPRLDRCIAVTHKEYDEPGGEDDDESSEARLEFGRLTGATKTLSTKGTNTSTHAHIQASLSFLFEVNFFYSFGRLNKSLSSSRDGIGGINATILHIRSHRMHQLASIILAIVIWWLLEFCSQRKGQIRRNSHVVLP